MYITGAHFSKCDHSKLKSVTRASLEGNRIDLINFRNITSGIKDLNSNFLYLYISCLIDQMHIVQCLRLSAVRRSVLRSMSPYILHNSITSGSIIPEPPECCVLHHLDV